MTRKSPTREQRQAVTELVSEGNCVLDTLPLADAMPLLRTAQLVVWECWMDERLWELSPARNVAGAAPSEIGAPPRLIER
jgi:hypothetical protein